MKKEDFLLLVVAAGKDEPLTPVQLQKSLFLIGEQGIPEIPEEFYDFQPYHYGPFDVRVYQDADTLKEDGMVLRFKSDSGNWANTVATYSGRKRAEQLKSQMDPAVVQYIENVVDWAQSMNFRELVAAIYQAYPEYRENSVFQD